MQNYFNYFTEIEERFQRRRGSLLMLSTLDWALIEVWREAGIPLEAVLRGIDNAFDKHDAKTVRSPGRARRVNGLAWCMQSVMEAVEQAIEASVGGAPTTGDQAADKTVESGFEAERVGRYLEQNARAMEEAMLNPPADAVSIEVAGRLRALALGLRNEPIRSLEELDRTLGVLEEKLFAALLTAAPEEELVGLREQAARELAPYRGKMQAVQIRQVQQQLLQKKMLETRRLPRLSLFYMSQG
jgi:hypothetical protein